MQIVRAKIHQTLIDAKFTAGYLPLGPNICTFQLRFAVAGWAKGVDQYERFIFDNKPLGA
jgi:hypothetical protein